MRSGFKEKFGHEVTLRNLCSLSQTRRGLLPAWRIVARCCLFPICGGQHVCSDSCMSVRASWLRPWSACETAEAHEARHPGFGYHQTCPQCRFYKRAQSWMGAYGTVPAPGHGFDSAQWLDERPSRWGGGGPGDWAASSALTQWQQFSSSRARAAVLRRPRSPVLGCPRIGSGEVEPRGRGSKFDAGRR